MPGVYFGIIQKVLRKTGLVVLDRAGTSWRYRTDQARLDEALSALAGDLPRSTEPRTEP